MFAFFLLVFLFFNFASSPDLRHALNNLQSTYAGLGSITAENVFKVVDQPHPIVVQSIINNCAKGEVRSALLDLQTLWSQGYAAVDIISTLFRVAKNAEINEKLKMYFIKEIGITHMRIADGVGTLLQLTGLVARLCQLSVQV